jgi:hypothetical protein
VAVGSNPETWTVGIASEVPGGALSNLIAGQALRHVRDPALARYSAALFGKLTGQPVGWRPTLDEVAQSQRSAVSDQRSK